MSTTRGIRQTVAGAALAGASVFAILARGPILGDHGRPGEGPLGPFLLFGYWAAAHLAVTAAGVWIARAKPEWKREYGLTLDIYLVQGLGHLSFFAWCALGGEDPTGGALYAAIAALSFFLGPVAALFGLAFSRRGGLLFLGQLVAPLGLLATVVTGSVHA